jgi:hypothetical protein
VRDREREKEREIEREKERERERKREINRERKRVRDRESRELQLPTHVVRQARSAYGHFIIYAVANGGSGGGGGYFIRNLRRIYSCNGSTIGSLNIHLKSSSATTFPDLTDRVNVGGLSGICSVCSDKKRWLWFLLTSAAPMGKVWPQNLFGHRRRHRSI